MVCDAGLISVSKMSTQNKNRGTGGETGTKPKSILKSSLRSQVTSNYVFGIGKEMPKNQLPKFTDVIKYKYYLTDHNKTDTDDSKLIQLKLCT